MPNFMANGAVEAEKSFGDMSKKGNNFERDLVDTIFHGFCRFGPDTPYLGPQTTIRKVYKTWNGLIYG